MRCRKCFRNVDISNELFNARYRICMHIPSQLYDYIFRKRTIHCLNEYIHCSVVAYFIGFKTW